MAIGEARGRNQEPMNGLHEWRDNEEGDWIRGCSCTSSSVARKAAMRSVGSLEMKPTVSVSNTSWPYHHQIHTQNETSGDDAKGRQEDVSSGREQ